MSNKGNLYTNSDENLKEMRESNKRLTQLSIEYDPLNEIKKDLKITTVQDQKDFQNTRKLREFMTIQDKFEGRRVVPTEDIIEYCLSNNYTIQNISEYRSEITRKALEAIGEFSKENKIKIT